MFYIFHTAIHLGAGVRRQHTIQKLVAALDGPLQDGPAGFEENPRITGYEFAVLCLATYCCPKTPLIPILEKTLAELQNRQPDQRRIHKAGTLATLHIMAADAGKHVLALPEPDFLTAGKGSQAEAVQS